MALISERIDSLSDEENELNVANVARKRKSQIIDSDSETEVNHGGCLNSQTFQDTEQSAEPEKTDENEHIPSELNEEPQKESEEETATKSLGYPEKYNLDQDSDDESTKTNVVKKQKSQIIDSDSETEVNNGGCLNAPTLQDIEQTSEPEKTDQNEHIPSEINEELQKESEEETATKSLGDPDKYNLDQDSDHESTKTHNRRKQNTIIDSDSDDSPKLNTTKRRNRIESDSDSEQPENRNLDKGNTSKYNLDDSEDDLLAGDNKNREEEAIYNIDNRGQLVPEKPVSFSSRLEALYDSDSPQENSLQEEEELETTKSKVYRKKRSKTSEEQPKKFSAREASKQRTEIKSESQRMLRESNVSLPYHKPRTFSLKEFLEKRSKLASALPEIAKAPPSVAIKMPKEQLLEVSKKLDERMKLVQEFYKSESEEEEVADDFEKEIRDCIESILDQIEEKDGEESSNMEIDNLLEKYPTDELAIEETVTELPKEQSKVVVGDQPRLSWGPSTFIDLNEDVARCKQVKDLMQKFIRHSLPQSTHKPHKIETKVLGFTQGEIIDENVAITVDDDEETQKKIVETPGAKLSKLRQELESQMALKRAQMWKEKLEQDTSKPEGCKDSYEDGDDDYFNENEEEEAEMTETETEEEEEEALEDMRPEKPRKKSAFVSEEAEEDDEEGIEGDIDEEHDDETDNLNENEDDVDPEDHNEDVEHDEEATAEEECDENAEEPKETQSKSKSRILKPFTEDSDNEDNDTQEEPTTPHVISHRSIINDDDYIPPNLPKEREETPQRTQTVDTDIDFLTPVTFLTGLQNLSSAAKLRGDSPSTSKPNQSPGLTQLLLTPQEPTPVKSIQKNLFAELTTQETLDELAAVCTGNFETQTDKTDSQNLLALCSGKFSGIESTQINAESQSDDLGISQVLHGEALETFRKKFESPKFTQQESENAGVLDSDEETDGVQVKTKKNQKKLTFSDDEDEPEEQEEEIGLHDEDNSEEDMEKAPEDIDYDSEENEIERPRELLRAQDFFEKEAELTESEWDSADEDEKDLDLMDFEQGDKEKFDEEELRSDIEKIHMRQIIDEDNRDVKILQELLLEDGELHGAGRQRQYRWKNMDSGVEGETNNQEEGEPDEEDLHEEEWRKMRHKREMFLKQQKTVKDDVDKMLEDSQILKFGKNILQRTSQISQNTQNKITNGLDTVESSLSILRSKRGSFLSRNDQVLQRLAEFNKVTEVNITGAKNSRGFVFQSVETKTMISKETNKRKASEGTPNVLKRLRLSAELSPATSGAKSSKNLFGN